MLITSQPSTSLKAVRVCFQALVVTSQSRTVPSLQVDASVRPSDEEATIRIGYYGLGGSVSRLLVVAFRTVTVPSHDADASVWLCGEKATA